MKLPEYYPTRAEMKIFTEQKEDICDAFTERGQMERGHSCPQHGEADKNVRVPIDLIELGAGDGTKTAVLIGHLLANNVDFTYQPIDISQEANDALEARFKDKFPDLRIDPHTGDYFKVLGSLKNNSGRRKVIMFLGSNIGNFLRDNAVAFFRSLRAVMNENDRLFVGFDMQKDPRTIVAAYDDKQGVTSAFNLNLLTRINRELGGDFDLEKFSHYAQYRPMECAARSFLISREKQSVTIKALNRSFDFDQWEPIFMEISQKYTHAMIDELAGDGGFEIAQEFYNAEDFYIDSLWRPV
jgi:uncharacterized SAM-dependent methyltransferase